VSHLLRKGVDGKESPMLCREHIGPVAVPGSVNRSEREIRNEGNLIAEPQLDPYSTAPTKFLLLEALPTRAYRESWLHDHRRRVSFRLNIALGGSLFLGISDTKGLYRRINCHDGKQRPKESKSRGEP